MAAVEDRELKINLTFYVGMLCFVVSYGSENCCPRLSTMQKLDLFLPTCSISVVRIVRRILWGYGAWCRLEI